MPTDGGASFRGGAAEGPAGIRRFSESIESYSPRAKKDLVDLSIVDAGDRPEDSGDAELPALLADAWEGAGRPLLLTLGGDHAVTPPTVRAIAERLPDLVVVGFDAHLDLRAEYPGEHACTFRRLTDLGVPCLVLGPRSGARDEWRDADERLAFCSSALVLPDEVRRRLEGRPCYLTVDIDVLDPAVAPGTGNPEPDGPSFGALLGAIESLEALDVVAADIVEVAPPLDGSGITQVTAATLARELVLRFAR